MEGNKEEIPIIKLAIENSMPIEMSVPSESAVAYKEADYLPTPFKTARVSVNGKLEQSISNTDKQPIGDYDVCEPLAYENDKFGKPQKDDREIRMDTDQPVRAGNKLDVSNVMQGSDRNDDSIPNHPGNENHSQFFGDAFDMIGVGNDESRAANKSLIAGGFDETMCYRMLKFQMSRVTVPTKSNHCHLDYCLFCQQPFSSSSLCQHYFSTHSDQPRIKEIFLGEGEATERLVYKIRMLGNYQHNTRVIGGGEGELVTTCRPTKYVPAYRFLPCYICYGFYCEKCLSSHVSSCKMADSTSTTAAGDCFTQALILLAPFCGQNQPKRERKKKEINKLSVGLKEIAANTGLLRIMEQDDLIKFYAEQEFSKLGNPPYCSEIINCFRTKMASIAGLVKALRLKLEFGPSEFTSYASRTGEVPTTAKCSKFVEGFQSSNKRRMEESEKFNCLYAASYAAQTRCDEERELDGTIDLQDEQEELMSSHGISYKWSTDSRIRWKPSEQRIFLQTALPYLEGGQKLPKDAIKELLRGLSDRTEAQIRARYSNYLTKKLKLSDDEISENSGVQSIVPVSRSRKIAHPMRWRPTEQKIFLQTALPYLKEGHKLPKDAIKTILYSLPGRTEAQIRARYSNYLTKKQVFSYDRSDNSPLYLPETSVKYDSSSL